MPVVGRARPLLLLGALFVAVGAALLVSSDGPAETGELRGYRAEGRAGKSFVVRFKVTGVRPGAVRGGELRIGAARIRVSTRRLQRGLRGGVLRLRLTGRAAQLARQRTPRLRLRLRRFPEYDGLSVSRGALSTSQERSWDGGPSLVARFRGGPAGFQRVWRNVRWRRGADVWYAMALAVPDQSAYCYWNPMRWDNYRTYGPRGDVGGLTVEPGRVSVMQSRYGGRERTLVGPVALPQSRWVLLQVHQRLSNRPGVALSELYVNGKLAGSSSAPNSTGRVINNVRFGVVNVAGGCSREGEVFFDGISTARGRRDPQPASLQR